MRIRAAEVATVVGGELIGPDVALDGASQDSREVASGQLFVPVVAERDGHQFIADALARGAAAYLTAGPIEGGSAIRVGDTVAALQQLATHLRDRLGNAAVIAITGSVGKTSTKDLLASVLTEAGPTHASPRSFNNELGVPLTIVNAPDMTAALVVEMGSRGPGQIAELCRVASPSSAVVTMVGLAHTSEFGSIEAVAEAKSEIVQGLPAEGWAVLNAEVPLVAAMADRTAAQVISFGGHRGDVRAESVVMADDLTSRFRLVSPWGDTDIVLGARGRHNVVNACAAAAASLAVGVNMSAVVTGLAVPRLSPWRMELSTTPAGATVLNDAYNANPLSVASALASLAALPADRRVAVLGLMAELGESSDAEHRRMYELAVKLGVEVIAVDAPYGDALRVADVDEAERELLDRHGHLGPGTAVLVKGSRVAGLERLADRLIRPDPD